MIELLVVLATIALLAALLLPTLASTKQNNQAAQCLENHRRLMAAWRMYAEDNNSILAPNDYPYRSVWYTASATQRAQMKNWVVGTMASAIDVKAGSGLANGYSELLDRNGTLFTPYAQDKQIYHCPADQLVDPNAHVVHPRSVSMNSAVGTTWSVFYSSGSPLLGAPVAGGWLQGSAYNASQTAWLTFGKLSSFTRPGPANTFVLIDESALTINSGDFACSAAAYSDRTYLIDYPSGDHNGAATLSFADGHALTHKWLDRRTYNPPPTGPGMPAIATETPPDPDCYYLAPITSAPR